MQDDAAKDEQVSLIVVNAAAWLHPMCKTHVESDVNMHMRCGRTCVEQMLREGAFRSPSHWRMSAAGDQHLRLPHT
jgi:hypothetical protein